MIATEILSRVIRTRPALRKIANLELHLVHSCNLACESCSHYSNQNHKGILSLKEAEEWMQLWNRRINPATFSLLGGEPTIHPELPEFLILARQYWPRAHLRLVTNGFFLHRHPRLPLVLKRDRQTSLCLSIHHEAPEYQEKLKPIRELLDGWIRDHGIRVVYYRSHNKWTRRYKGFGADMEPFEDHQPRQSWEHCPARECRQLFNGKIWKCGPLAYLTLQNAKYQLSEKWKSYLQYQPLSPDCSDAELHQFFDREDEAVCGMCPARPEKFALPVPLKHG